jgi:hypothetical protein
MEDDALSHDDRLEPIASLGDIVASPFSHDLRGAISIVRLTAQVLERSRADDKLVTKLSSSAVRLEALLADLRLAALVRGTLEAHEEKAGTWSEAIDGSLAFAHVVYRDRETIRHVDSSVGAGLAPPYADMILWGLIDAVARLTRSSDPVSISVQSSPGVVARVSGPCRELTGEVRALLQASPETWAGSGISGALFRYVSAFLQAKKIGGRANLTHEDGQLVASAEF